MISRVVIVISEAVIEIGVIHLSRRLRRECRGNSNHKGHEENNISRSDAEYFTTKNLEKNYPKVLFRGICAENCENRQ
jgi:hypothetical protein